MRTLKCPCGQPVAECHYSLEKRTLACPSFREINAWIRKEEDLKKQLAEAQAEIERLAGDFNFAHEGKRKLEKENQTYREFVAAYDEFNSHDRQIGLLSWSVYKAEFNRLSEQLKKPAKN